MEAVLGARRGSMIMVAFGGIMVAIGWTMNSYAETLPYSTPPPFLLALVGAPFTLRASGSL